MAVAQSRIHNPKSKIPNLKFSFPWGVTIGYLTIMLLLPVTALLLQASQVGIAEFWRIATSPMALSAYNVTFVTALVATVVNGGFGLLTA